MCVFYIRILMLSFYNFICSAWKSLFLHVKFNEREWKETEAGENSYKYLIFHEKSSSKPNANMLSEKTCITMKGNDV